MATAADPVRAEPITFPVVLPLLQYHSERTVDITGLSGHWRLA